MAFLAAAKITRTILAVLLSFVLLLAPVSHSIAMPAGHKMTTNVASEAVVEDVAKGHHKTATSDTKKQSSCGDSSAPKKAEKNCCEVGCLSFATMNGGFDIFAVAPLSLQHSAEEQQLFSRSVSSLKRPPRI